MPDKRQPCQVRRSHRGRCIEDGEKRLREEMQGDWAWRVDVDAAKPLE